MKAQHCQEYLCTLYPDTRRFSVDFDASRYRQLLAKKSPTIAPLSLNVSIPFAEPIDGNSDNIAQLIRHTDKVRGYLYHLKKEIELISPIVGKARPVNHIYCGYGTLPAFSSAELTELLYAISSHFNLLGDDSRDYCIKIDPNTIAPPLLALLKGLGFNHLSFVIYDFFDAAITGYRRQPFNKMLELVKAARDYQFKLLSFDVVYDLPGQSAEILQTRLRDIIAVKPDRIALCNYTHFSNMAPPKSKKSFKALSTAEQTALIATASDTLDAANYLHLGMNQFVLPNDELARAQKAGKLQCNHHGYAARLTEDMVGIGAGAISCTACGYAQNAEALAAYYHSIDVGVLPIHSGIVLSDDDTIRRHVITQLSCNLTLDFRDMEKQLGIVAPSYFQREWTLLNNLVDEGLIELDEQHLQVTPKGQHMLPNICRVFYRH